MARKSRKQIQGIDHFLTEFPLTVGYARLSVNDRIENHSIENRKSFLFGLNSINFRFQNFMWMSDIAAAPFSVQLSNSYFKIFLTARLNVSL